MDWLWIIRIWWSKLDFMREGNCNHGNISYNFNVYWQVLDKILWPDFRTCGFDFVKVSSGDLSNCIVDVVSTLLWHLNHVYNNNDMCHGWHELCNLGDHICKHKWVWWSHGWWGLIRGVMGAPQTEVRVHFLDIQFQLCGECAWLGISGWEIYRNISHLDG